MTKERKAEYLRLYAAAFSDARTRAGMSFKDVAEKAGLSFQTVKNFERDACEPGAMNFAAMMTAVGIHTGALLRRAIVEMRDDD